MSLDNPSSEELKKELSCLENSLDEAVDLRGENESGFKTDLGRIKLVDGGKLEIETEETHEEFVVDNVKHFDYMTMDPGIRFYITATSDVLWVDL